MNASIFLSSTVIDPFCKLSMALRQILLEAVDNVQVKGMDDVGVVVAFQVTL
jgi:hypothetical protein